jgi:hypothetical protein
MFLDRTTSKIGQEFLYNRLRTIPFDSKKIFEHEKLIKELTENSDFRVNLQNQLSKIK